MNALAFFTFAIKCINSLLICRQHKALREEMLNRGLKHHFTHQNKLYVVGFTPLQPP